MKQKWLRQKSVRAGTPHIPSGVPAAQDDLGGRFHLSNDMGGFNASKPGHLDIHDHEGNRIGPSLEQVYSLQPVLRRMDVVPHGRDQEAERLQHQRFIVDNQHIDNGWLNADVWSIWSIEHRSVSK